MKYESKQFNVLLNVLKELNNDFNLKEINPNALHFTVYQQLNEGQKHNKLFIFNNKVVRGNQLTAEEKTNAKSYIKTVCNDFLLYPEGCNDNHIETAVKKAIKLINN